MKVSLGLGGYICINARRHGFIPGNEKKAWVTLLARVLAGAPGQKAPTISAANWPDIAAQVQFRRVNRKAAKAA